MGRFARIGVWALLVLNLLACAEGKKHKRLAVHPGPRKGAVLTGTVRLAPGAALPSYASADMARRPLRPTEVDAAPGECEAANAAARHPVKLVAKGALAGIVVAASDFTRHREREPASHKVAIRHCSLLPQVLTATVGDTVVIENADQRDYVPMFGPLVQAFALPPGERFRIPLRGAGIESIMCTRQAPCGRSDVVAFHHSVHTVTDAKGNFRLEGFPAGESVRVSAWHPLFEVSETFVWLEPNEKREAELVIRPRPGL